MCLIHRNATSSNTFAKTLGVLETFAHSPPMKKSPAGTSRPQPQAARKKSTAVTGKIHPVVIYPFRQPGNYADLKELYELIARLDADKNTYARPITVIDRKTVARMEGNRAFHEFSKNTVSRHSEILDGWSVDTCQMWYWGSARLSIKAAPMTCIGSSPAISITALQPARKY